MPILPGTYACHFPGCGYVSSQRSGVDYHHILPRHMGGTNKPSNLIPLCPACHRKIYVPDCVHGPHSLLRVESAIVMGNLASSQGLVWVFRLVQDGRVICYSPNNPGLTEDFGDLSSLYPDTSPKLTSDGVSTVWI